MAELRCVRPSDDERIAQLEGRVKALEDARRRRAWLEGAVYAALGLLSLLRMLQR